MLFRRVVVAAAAALMLAGCTGNGGNNASSSATAADLNGAQLSIAGFAGVELGKQLGEGYNVQPETECKGQVLLDADGKPTIEVWTAESGEVTTIIAGSVPTDKGVKVGDGVEAVVAAYPEATGETVTGVEAHVVRDEKAALVFEITDGVVTHISLQPLAGLHAVGTAVCE